MKLEAKRSRDTPVIMGDGIGTNLRRRSSPLPNLSLDAGKSNPFSEIALKCEVNDEHWDKR